MGKLYLRRAALADCELLWRWANDVEVRQNSFQMEAIPLDKHRAWSHKILSDDNVRLYILQESDEAVGQVRLMYNKKWQISYSIALAYRGQGYGKIILQLAENELIMDGHAGETLLAEVKTDNIASQRIFIRLGYREVECKRSDAHAYDKVMKTDLYNIEELPTI